MQTIQMSLFHYGEKPTDKKQELGEKKKKISIHEKNDIPPSQSNVRADADDMTLFDDDADVDNRPLFLLCDVCFCD